MRVVFMGTPAFAVPTLANIHNAGHTVVAVYSQPPRPAGRGKKLTPSPVHSFAEANHIPVYTPESLKNEASQAEFINHNADIAIVIAYGLLIPKPLLEAYPLGCINVHPSTLPRWRGAAPIQRTIMAGDKETSLTIMQMDEGLDTGDILLSQHYVIEDGTTSGDLLEKFSVASGPLVISALKALQTDSITPQPQSEDGVVYAQKITKEECQLNWTQPADTLYQTILGLNPIPAAFFNYNGEKIKLFDAHRTTCPAGTPPATVCDDELTIACGEGALKLTNLQRPGKTRMSADELLRGFSIPKGTVLN